jgi:hypothetical protein
MYVHVIVVIIRYEQDQCICVVRNFKNISISIASNIAIIATKSTIEYVKERFFFYCHKFNMVMEQVNRKLRHFMFVSPPQYGLIFLQCI